MGEARRRRILGLSPNGHDIPRMQVVKKTLRIVPNIRLENDTREGAVMMMLGEDTPELATQMTPEEARKLASALNEHADELDATSRNRIIIPGGP